MGTMEDYIKWRGDLSFKNSPFNAVDNLIMSELAYVNLCDVAPMKESTGKIKIEDMADKYFRLYDEKYLRSIKSFVWYAPFLMREMAKSLRFKDIEISDYKWIYDYEKQEQFAALTANLKDGSIYIAFMGTDDTIIGWKEDFNMSFLTPIPSQLDAVSYVEMVSKKHPLKKLRIGGHSKGGNLAIYSAVKASKNVRKKIINVYNNDGPGFDKKMISTDEYQEMKKVIKTYVPYHSFFGMLLEHDEDYVVVKSSQKGIMQHEPMSWQVMGNDFEKCEEVSENSCNMNKVISSWIEEIDIKQRAEFVNLLFEIVTASGVETITQLQQKGVSAFGASVKTFTMLDRQKKKMLLSLLKSFTGEFDKVYNKNEHV